MQKINETITDDIQLARSSVDTNPTDGQIKAGNYRKGKISFNGFLITIENPKGSYRRGKDKDGHEWKTLMHNDYGYFNRTVGKDGDAIDVFIGPNLKSEKIYPIDQFLNGKFDETKVMLGFNTAEEAKAAYLSNYEKDWKGFKYITEVNLDKFKKWLYDGYRQRKPFAKYIRLTENKETQLSIINDTNPMLDDYHTGIRKVEDIKTFEEAMAEAKADFDEYGTYSSYPDTPNSVLENALRTGRITVYSSKPISNGNFVTTSKMCAKDYAGGGKIFSETLPTSDIAWINVEEGQVARLNRLNESMSNRMYDAMEDYSHSDLLEEFVRDRERGVAQKRWNLIPFEQYRNVRERFLQEPAMARIPLNLVMSWFDIIIHNTLSISYITDFAGHSSYFPSDDIEYALGREVEGYSDGWRVLDELGFYDWARLPDGSDGWSDYGLTPLYNIIGEFSENMAPGDILMLIDRALDVGHCRGNLASAFIEGGSKSCDSITSKQTLNESPDSADGMFEYNDNDAYAFIYIAGSIPKLRQKTEGRYFISDIGGETHPALIERLAKSGIISPDIVENDYNLLWDDAGRYWAANRVISFWNTPYESGGMRDIINLICEKFNVNREEILVDVWDYNSISESLVPYKWFVNGTFSFIAKDLKARSIYEQDNDIFRVNSDSGVFYMDINGNIVNNPYEYKRVDESKKVRRNDKGEVVPETCECGGKVCLQIHGEPVFICSKCGKYYGTMPFIKESFDVKKALKNLKKRRDPANIEDWDKELNENNMINENFSSQVLAKLAKEHGGIQISRNGGLRDFPCAFLRGHGVNPSDITDDMIVGEPYEYSSYDRKSDNAVLFNDGTAVELDRNVELPQRTSGARRLKRFGSGIGDTGDHDKTRGGFIGKGKDAESAPYNGWQSSERAGYSQSLRDAFKANKEMGDKKTMDAIKQKARTVYMTEEQFKSFNRFLLREKRNEDYAKGLIQEMTLGGGIFQQVNLDKAKEYFKWTVDYLNNEGVVAYDYNNLKGADLANFDYVDLCKATLYQYGSEMQDNLRDAIKDYIKTRNNSGIEEAARQGIQEYLNDGATQGWMM